MENRDIWNKIVSLYEKNYSEEEFRLQDLWEKIFEQYFHYHSLDDEIDTQRTIHLGSSERVIPDIILKKDNKDSIVVELKKSSIAFHEKYKQQLFSYLKQLKVSIGILITNKINLFLYNYTKADDEQQCVEIEFTKDNLLGEKFVQLFNKSNLSIDLIKDFVESNCKIKDDLFQIKSMTNEEFIKDILIKYYKDAGFNELAIDNFIKSIHIIVKNTEKETITPIIHSQINNVKFKSNISTKSLSYQNYTLNKDSALRICQKNNILLSGYITFANLNTPSGTYPANVNLNYLNHEWSIVLNDGYSRKLHIFKIPANTFTYEDFAIRTDTNKVVLSIDTSFVDMHRRKNIENRLFKYKIQTIDYSDET